MVLSKFRKLTVTFTVIYRPYYQLPSYVPYSVTMSFYSLLIWSNFYCLQFMTLHFVLLVVSHIKVQSLHFCIRISQNYCASCQVVFDTDLAVVKLESVMFLHFKIFFFLDTKYLEVYTVLGKCVLMLHTCISVLIFCAYFKAGRKIILENEIQLKKFLTFTFCTPVYAFIPYGVGIYYSWLCRQEVYIMSFICMVLQNQYCVLILK